jgi:hypothetical protein
MKLPRFKIRTLMALVLVVAMGCAFWRHTNFQNVSGYGYFWYMTHTEFAVRNLVLEINTMMHNRNGEFLYMNGNFSVHRPPIKIAGMLP